MPKVLICSVAVPFVGRLVEGRLFVAEESWLEVPPGAEEVT
jgi:hypothetical protein